DHVAHRRIAVHDQDPPRGRLLLEVHGDAARLAEPLQIGPQDAPVAPRGLEGRDLAVLDPPDDRHRRDAADRRPVMRAEDLLSPTPPARHVPPGMMMRPPMTNSL